MTQFLLDTSIIIDVLNNKHNGAKLISNLLSEGHIFYCCSINIEAPKKQAFIDQYIRGYEMIPEDTAVNKPLEIIQSQILIKEDR